MSKWIQVGTVYKPMIDSNAVHSFKNYKQAKIHLEKCEAILMIINKSIQAFTLFEVYGSAKNCLTTLKSEKILVEVSIAKMKAILESKGKL